MLNQRVVVVEVEVEVEVVEVDVLVLVVGAAMSNPASHYRGYPSLK
jgi:hypothetical protein